MQMITNILVTCRVEIEIVMYHGALLLALTLVLTVVIDYKILSILRIAGTLSRYRIK